ncbi:Enhancer of polycomb-like protein 1 [Oopsacas minuta]|uniref:Enhancer of polycomb-like protein n=1 Tax=Oopsacas minuta TaxID=111878 RepID=A0AAV7K155_9METZ|nr:Enhancer of polycomb-like protein 1 [Oopsacas minuta]
MSRLYFRSRALDIHKALPIYLSSGIRDLSECSTINRDVPLMPTGMEKEEENETHFQLALIAQKRKISNVPKFVYKENIIPTPKVDLVTLSHSETEIKILDDDCIYFKINLFEDVTTDHLSEYDMDSDDEAWLSAHESYGVSESIRFVYLSCKSYDNLN